MTEDETPRHPDDERRGMNPLENSEKALLREVEVVAEHFPDTEPAVVEATVREVIADLRADAEVQTHVLALARPQAYDRLRERGEPFQTPKDTQPDSDA